MRRSACRRPVSRDRGRAVRRPAPPPPPRRRPHPGAPRRTGRHQRDRHRRPRGRPPPGAAGDDRRPPARRARDLERRRPRRDDRRRGGRHGRGLPRPPPRCARRPTSRCRPGVASPATSPASSGATRSSAAHDELARLGAAWERRVRVVLVSGEAGAGKTRLVGELAASMPDDAVVLWGRCTQDRLGAYEPFVDPVRADRRAPSPRRPARRRRARPAAARAGRRPDVGRRRQRRRARGRTPAAVRGGRRAARRVGPDAARPRGRALGRRGVAVAADPPRRRPPARRPDDRSPPSARPIRTGPTPAPSPSCAVTRRSNGSTLGGLGAADLAALVDDVAGGAAAPELVRTVADGDGGQPVLRRGADRAPAGRQRHGWRGRGDGPDRAARDARAATASRCPTTPRRCLRSGAVLGRRFPSALAGRLVDLPPERVVAAVEDALLSGLVTEASATVVSFSHALVQSAVYETTSAQRRLLLHRRAAEELEAAADAAFQPTTPPCSTSPATGRSWPRPTRAQRSHAARWARRAGDAAMVATDVDEAIARYELAERLATGATDERAETLLEPRRRALGDRSGRRRRRARFRAALAVADELGDVALYGRAAIGLAATVRYGHSDPQRIAVARHGDRPPGPRRAACCGRPPRRCSSASSASTPASPRTTAASRPPGSCSTRCRPTTSATSCSCRSARRARLDRRRRPGRARPAEPPDRRRRVVAAEPAGARQRLVRRGVVGVGARRPGRLGHGDDQLHGDRRRARAAVRAGPGRHDGGDHGAVGGPLRRRRSARPAGLRPVRRQRSRTPAPCS